jgi:hypothetical protein
MMTTLTAGTPAIFGRTLALPTKADLALSPSATAGDDQDTGITLSRKPLGFGTGATGNKVVLVDINGTVAEVGDGVKTKDCFFSDSASAPYAAKYFGDLAAGDKLIWNDSVAGYSLETRFVVRLFYLSLYLIGPAIWGSMVWGSFTWGA